jgi:hypothetical protein
VTELFIQVGTNTVSYERFCVLQWALGGQVGDTSWVQSCEQTIIQYRSESGWVNLPSGETAIHPVYTDFTLSCFGQWVETRTGISLKRKRSPTHFPDGVAFSFPKTYIKRNMWIKDIEKYVQRLPRLGNTANASLLEVWRCAVQPPALFLPSSDSYIKILEFLISLKEDMSLKHVSALSTPELPRVDPSLVIADILRDGESRPLPRKVVHDYIFGEEERSTAAILSSWYSCQPDSPDRLCPFYRQPQLMADVACTESGVRSVQVPYELSEPGDLWTNIEEGIELRLSTSCVPGGNLTDMHVDAHVLYQYMVHITGLKVWLFWPPTDRNLRIMRTTFPEANLQEPYEWMDFAKKLEQPELLVTGPNPVHFVLPPSTIHSVLTLTPSMHFGGTFIRPRTLKSDLRLYEKLKTILSTDMQLEDMIRERMRWLDLELRTAEEGKLNLEDFYEQNRNLQRIAQKRLDVWRKQREEIGRR